MADNYGINEVKNEGVETFADIQQNRTLMAEQFTSESATLPKVVHGLQTVDQIFAHYRPSVDIQFEATDGRVKMETLSFQKMEDFGLEAIAAQSEFLQNLKQQRDEQLNIIRQLKSNKVLTGVLMDEQIKNDFVDALNSMIAVLKNNQ